MDFPGIWMTETRKLVYRVVPKCACSTIKQIMFFSDHGYFYEGDFATVEQGLYKSGMGDSDAKITQALTQERPLIFSCVRNPYERLLSCFFDKVAGIQSNGRYYRQSVLSPLFGQYGIDVGHPDTGFDFDQIESFRRFVGLAHETIMTKQPIAPDLHWGRMNGALWTLANRGPKFDQIFFVERFNEGMRRVLDAAELTHEVDLAWVPRFNESDSVGPKRLHSVGDYYDDHARHLMREMYAPDFENYNYDPDDPENRYPSGEVDIDRLNRTLGPK